MGSQRGVRLRVIEASEAPRPRTLTDSTRRLFLLLWSLDDGGHYVVATQEELAEHLGVATKTVSRATRALERHNFVVVARERGVEGRVYKLLRRSWPEQAGADGADSADTGNGQTGHGQPTLVSGSHAGTTSSSSSNQPDTGSGHWSTPSDTADVSRTADTIPAEVYSYLQIEPTRQVLDALADVDEATRFATYRRFREFGGRTPRYLLDCLATEVDLGAGRRAVGTPRLPERAGLDAESIEGPRGTYRTAAASVRSTPAVRWVALAMIRLAMRALDSLVRALANGGRVPRNDQR